MNNVISLFDTPNTGAQEIITPVQDVVEEVPFVDYAGRSQKMFDVESHDISSPYGIIEGKKGLFVNEQNINIVSDKYEVVQPRQVFETFTDIADRSGLEINRTLLNPKNGGLMVSARFDNLKIMGDDHDVNVVFYTSHCGRYKTFLTLDILRLACFNQAPALYKNKDRFIFAEKHYKNALDINMLGGALENIPASVEAFNTKMELLGEKSMNCEQFVEWYVDQLKLDKESKQYDTKVQKFRETYKYATGQREIRSESAWKAFNAVTYINTHEGRNSTYKAENALLKGGDDTIKRLDALLTA